MLINPGSIKLTTQNLPSFLEIVSFNFESKTEMSSKKFIFYFNFVIY